MIRLFRSGALILARHRSGYGFWVLNRQPSGAVAAYHIDSTGVHLPAVVSRVGLPGWGFNQNYHGWDATYLTLNQRRLVVRHFFNATTDSARVIIYSRWGRERWRSGVGGYEGDWAAPGRPAPATT